ncbi:hypothetical protein F5146DRAFT_997626 [Armillaria mellea]|nr:hypothetical protein F5146DRAFT_997626 [Armillaria mellea]
MSSLSNYDSVVPTQQHDSTTPIKDVVDDTFEQWLHSLKSLVADAPVQIQINESEVLNQQDLKSELESGIHEQRMILLKLIQYQNHFRDQRNYIATISNAVVPHPTPFALNVHANQILAHFLEEHSPTVADSLNNEVILSGEQHGTAGHVKEYDLQCPLYSNAVFRKPRQIPIVESNFSMLNIPDTGAMDSKELLLSHLDQFFH